MHTRGRLRGRRLWLPLIGAALAATAVCGVMIARSWSPLPTSASIADGATAPASAGTPLVLHHGDRVLVFGDSWVYGEAAAPPTRGFAYLLADRLDVHTIVEGVRGSGYLKPGMTAPTTGGASRSSMRRSTLP